MDLYKQAMTVAETFDVSSPENSVVLYSISYLPTTRNRDLAFDCVRSNPGKMMIEHTACGAELVRLGLDSADKCNLPSEQIAAVWKAASKRFIEAASGNVCAFVEKADRRSVFRSMELPTILQIRICQNLQRLTKAPHRGAFCFLFAAVITFSAASPEYRTTVKQAGTA